MPLAMLWSSVVNPYLVRSYTSLWELPQVTIPRIVSPGRVLPDRQVNLLMLGSIRTSLWQALTIPRATRTLLGWLESIQIHFLIWIEESIYMFLANRERNLLFMFTLITFLLTSAWSCAGCGHGVITTLAIMDGAGYCLSSQFVTCFSPRRWAHYMRPMHKLEAVLQLAVNNGKYM